MTSDRGPGELTENDYRRLAAFRHALRVFLRFSEEAARAEGLTPNQHQLLLAIRGWPGHAKPSVSDIAERLQLRQHTTAELVQRASAAGLVASVIDPEDHRRHLLEVTSEGEARLRDLSVLHRDELSQFREHFSELLVAMG